MNVSSWGSGPPGRRGHQGQDFDLNLAPIIDCFTVLIAFMLASASFLAIGILDAGVAAAGATAASAAPPPISIFLDLGRDHRMTLKIRGKENRTTSIEARSGQWDFENLSRQLAGIKSRWTEVNGITLLADNSIEYRDVIKTMEQARRTLPAVMLDGF